MSQCRDAKSMHDIIKQKQKQNPQRNTGTDKMCSKRITVARSCMTLVVSLNVLLYSLGMGN